jgi:hypothetical protein
VIAEPVACSDDERDDDEWNKGQRERETQPAGPVTERGREGLAHGELHQRPRQNVLQAQQRRRPDEHDGQRRNERPSFAAHRHDLDPPTGGLGQRQGHERPGIHRIHVAYEWKTPDLPEHRRRQGDAHADQTNGEQGGIQPPPQQADDCDDKTEQSHGGATSA